tara:strand:+ start:4086 stop:4529 length:444 start_codon:yes stop_codon:yes gene_type:complete
VIGVAKPAAADLTAFVGSTQSLSNRNATGVAVGLSLAIIGFEFEYSNSSIDNLQDKTELKSSMLNVLLQSPFPISRLQFYGTIGVGLYRERLGRSRYTGLGNNMGAGVKVSLMEPFRLRFDYRSLRLGKSSKRRAIQRFYAGLTLDF